MGLEKLTSAEPEWGSETEPQDVTITYLQMEQPPQLRLPVLPEQTRIERVDTPTPELARWLYSVVGGPYRWYERLGWERTDWEEELAETGSEIWLLTLKGTPAGYCQVHATVHTEESQPVTHTEILYFGLMGWAHGQGAGRLFLEHMVAQAWLLAERHPLPPVVRVWVHTCDLDGPYALANYQKRGFEVYRRETHREIVLKESLTPWEAMFCR